MEAQRKDSFIAIFKIVPKIIGVIIVRVVEIVTTGIAKKASIQKNKITDISKRINIMKRNFMKRKKMKIKILLIKKKRTILMIKKIQKKIRLLLKKRKMMSKRR